MKRMLIGIAGVLLILLASWLWLGQPKSAAPTDLLGGGMSPLPPQPVPVVKPEPLVAPEPVVADPLPVVEEQDADKRAKNTQKTDNSSQKDRLQPGSSEPEIDSYKVELGADKLIKMPGSPAELRVWIGMPQYSANFSEEMVSASGSIAAVGQTAQVTPYAPAFEVAPTRSVCLAIHPTGSEVRFQLTPLKSGTFKVGADIYLYNSEECSGAPIPKAVESLQVTVAVDRGEVLQEHSLALWQVVWEKFLEFWGALVALGFALLLFLLRGWLKKRFGFEES